MHASLEADKPYYTICMHSNISISKSVAAMVSIEGTVKGKLRLYIQFLVNFDKDEYTPNDTLFILFTG